MIRVNTNAHMVIELALYCLKSQGEQNFTLHFWIEVRRALGVDEQYDLRVDGFLVGEPPTPIKDYLE